jgi:hypothetical protein
MSDIALNRSPSDILGETLLKRLVIILAIYQVTALAVIITWAVVTWNKPDWTIVLVPQFILEWSGVGAVAGALYRLSSYPKLTEQEKAHLYLWVLSKPFVSTALGIIVYFLTIGGLLSLKGDIQINHPELLAAIAFVAAFSDRFALSVLDKLSFSHVAKNES